MKFDESAFQLALGVVTVLLVALGLLVFLAFLVALVTGALSFIWEAVW